MKKLYLIIALLTIQINIFAQTFINREWQENYGNPLLTQWTKTIITQNGELITVGNTIVPTQGADVLVTRYDNSGNVIWTYTINNTGNTNDFGTDVFEDANGEIYVCGVTDNNSISNYDLMLIKINATGIDWTKTFNSPFSKNDLAISLTVYNGDIYVCASSESTSNNYDFLTLKYDASSNLVWQERYDYASLNDYPVGITTDGTKVIVTGTSASTNNNWDYTTVYYDVNGNFLNEKRDNVIGNGYDQPTSYAIDNLGNIYITGKGSTNGTDYDMKTIKIDTSFNIVWNNTFDEFGFEDQANAITIDGNNNVVVAGYSVQNNTKIAKLIKYDNAGSQLSSFLRYSDDLTGDANIKAITTNSSNEILLVCEIKGLNGTKDIALIKLDENCNTLWERKIESQINEVPTSVKVDNNGNIFVTYIQDMGGSSNIYSIERYSEHQATGNVLYTPTGIPMCMKNQLIVKFKNSAVNQSSINNSKIEISDLSFFLTPSAFSNVQNALSDICVSTETNNNSSCRINTSRVYPNFKTWQTTSISRLGETIKMPDYWTTLLLEFPTAINIKDAKERLDILTDVCYSEPNMFAEKFANANDPWYPTQNSLHTNSTFTNADINIEPAWDIVQNGGAKFVRVGVIDGDGSWMHEDFGYNGSDPNTSKLNGWNFNLNSNLKNDTANLNGLGNHGTNCLGIIGAVRNNGIGIAGIAGGNYTDENADKGVSLYALKIHDTASNATIPPQMTATYYMKLTDIANAKLTSSTSISTSNYAYKLHIQSDSWGLSTKYITDWLMDVDSASTTLRQATHGVNRNKCVQVCARGNLGGTTSPIPFATPTLAVYPACFDDDWVINVAGTNGQGERSSIISPFSHNIDIAAPCEANQTYGMQGTTSYHDFTGTSASTPQVAGVVALLMSYLNDTTTNYKNLSQEDCENIIQLSATDNNVGYPGYDTLSGWGRLNAGKALYMVQKPHNKLYHFGSNAFANCTKTFASTPYSTNDTIKIKEPYENDALTWFKAGKYIVNTHKITFTANYTLGTNDTIVKFWARPSSSNTMPLFNSSKILLPHEKLDILSCTTTQAITQGYCYEVFDTLGNPLGWWPTNIVANTPNDLQSEISILTHNKTAYPNGVISNTINNLEILVYPNPTNSSQTIEIKGLNNETVSINLLDMSGRLVKNIYEGVQASNSKKVVAEISTLPQGIYQYKINVGNDSKNIKIIKH